MPYVIPYLISEREPVGHRLPDGEWDPAGAEDCVPCSVLMGLNALHPGIAPATKAEAEALRLAAGYTSQGATSIERIVAAAQKRYGIGAIAIVDDQFRNLWDALKPGHGAAIIGRPANLPAGHPIRQYLKTFTSFHCTYVQRRSSLTKVWFMDPMAPAGPGFQQGYWVRQADLSKFYVGAGAIFGIAQQ